MHQPTIALTAEDLLAGAETVHNILIPPELLANKVGASGRVQVRPLSIGAFQTIMKAAKEDPSLIPLLMVKECLTEPKLNIQQVRELPVGLVEFLVAQVRTVSGLTEKKTS